MTNKKSAGYFLAGVVGALMGVVGGVLLAPKSGKETRADIAKLANRLAKNIKTKASETQERVEQVFGEVSEGTKQKYIEIRSAVIGRVAAVKTAGEKIDKDKYAQIVENVVEEYKDDLTKTKNGATKLISLFKKDWEKIKSALTSGIGESDRKAS